MSIENESPSGGSSRKLTGWLGRTSQCLLAAIPIVGIFFIMDTPSYLGWSVLREQYYGLFFAMIFISLFWLFPGSAKASRRSVPWYDHILALCSLASGLYIAVFYPDILRTLGDMSGERVFMGALTVMLVLEGIRRTGGPALFCVGIFFILYARFTDFAPGLFNAPATPWPDLVTFLYLDANALFGTTLGIAAVVVMAFILFGNILFAIGGGAFLSDLAMSAFGRFRGGPAKMAILASCFFGMLTGSAAANVASTGVFTIPLMKRVGYKPHVAGAVEAVASTGGSLTPPIMGAAAFVIAEFTGIPYGTVAIASIIPAVLYYSGVFIQVDLEAGKEGMKGLSREELPNLRKTLNKAYLFVIPLFAMIYALFGLNMAPDKSAFLGILAAFMAALFNKDIRGRFDWLWTCLKDTGRAMITMTAIVCMAGFVIGVINLCGLGFVLPMFLTQVAGDNVFLALCIVAVASIILGMGMPTVAVYILLGVLMAPSLVSLGVPLLAAHLFIQYFGTVSQFTPPICVASYAAAAIAGAPPMKTAVTAMRIGILAYPTPFLFVYSQAFFMEGPALEVLWAWLSATLGCLLIGCALVGYFLRPIPLYKRILAVPAALLLFTATDFTNLFVGLLQDGVGLLFALLILGSEFVAARRERRALASQPVLNPQL